MILKKPPDTTVTETEVREIADYALEKIKADPLIIAMFSTPLTAAIAISQLSSTADALYAGLRPFIGRPLGEIPNDLGKLNEVRKGIPGFTGAADLLSSGWVADLTAGLAGVVGHGVLLVAIVALGLLGARLVVGGVGARA